MTQRSEAASLPKEMLEASSVVHRKAERRPFMVLFLKAQLPKDSYVTYLGRLSFIYEALEEADDALRDHPVVGVMHSPELHRFPAIAQDMEFFAGPDWRNTRTLAPTIEEYIERIQWCANQAPPGFVAHQWLRYLGNVLAQPVLLRIMERAYGLSDEGTAFYRYPVDDSRAYLRSYHERMNSMPLSDDERRLVVEEGSHAFQHQIDFVDELAADLHITGPTEEEAERILAELAAEHP